MQWSNLIIEQQWSVYSARAKYLFLESAMLSASIFLGGLSARLISRRWLLIAILALLALDCRGLTAAQTIVGRWAPDPAQCTPVGGMIGIGPLDIVADEFQCRFDSVSRAGNIVTWHGRCGFPTPPEPATVVARLSGATLHVSINGANNGAYRRCR
jgi:hypothetical protein